MKIAIAFGFAVIAGLLAALETSLSVITKGRAERLVEEGRRGSSRVAEIANDPVPGLNSVMFTRMVAEITTIVLVAIVIFDHFSSDWIRIVLTVVIMVAVSFILWGVAPRTLGRQHPESTLRLFGPVVSVLTGLFGWAAKVMIMLGNALTPGKGFADGPFATEAELRDMVDIAEAADLIEASESKMIHKVFELGDTLVKEVMVPRTDMVFIPQDRTIRQAQSLALRSGYSRIPVVGDGIDDVLGVIYLKDITKRIFDFPEAQHSERVHELMRPASFVPETKVADDLLRDMQLRHSHLVIVIDEFGGTAGLATMEDIVEEIVGEIVDEYDAEVDNITQLGPDQYRVSARLELEELGELFDVSLEDEDVETVGGLMAKLLNVVPIQGSTVSHQGLTMTADKTVGRRHQIATVIVQREVPVEEEGQPADDNE